MRWTRHLRRCRRSTGPSSSRSRSTRRTASAGSASAIRRGTSGTWPGSAARPSRPRATACGPDLSRSRLVPVRGAVAAGHRLTAEAGARILAEGGNAVDACIAAAFMSWVAESPLTGPGAGGFMLVHRARDRSTRLLDFFVATPGLGARARRRPEMESVDVDFSGESTQMFHIGSASCAVPGAVAGLAAAHPRYASLPWRMLMEPAIEAAGTGIELSRPQAYLHAI